jgi:hypothetical protein
VPARYLQDELRLAFRPLYTNYTARPPRAQFGEIFFQQRRQGRACPAAIGDAGRPQFVELPFGEGLAGVGRRPASAALVAGKSLPGFPGTHRRSFLKARVSDFKSQISD